MEDSKYLLRSVLRSWMAYEFVSGFIYMDELNPSRRPVIVRTIIRYVNKIVLPRPLLLLISIFFMFCNAVAKF